MTCVATKVVWYSPCVILSRGGESGRSVGGCKGWVVSWVYVRWFYLYGFVKGLLLRYLGGIFLGRVSSCELGSLDGVSWEILNGPWLGDLEGFLVINFIRILAG